MYQALYNCLMKAALYIGAYALYRPMPHFAARLTEPDCIRMHMISCSRLLLQGFTETRPVRTFEPVSERRFPSLGRHIPPPSTGIPCAGRPFSRGRPAAEFPPPP